MRTRAKQSSGKKAFTIVELLTVMSIIIILLGLLIPALNTVKRYARDVNQNSYFHTIEVGLELFSNQWDGYPDSDEKDEANESYCGAMKLAEAMIGQDKQGFHVNSHFLNDGTDGAATPTDYYPDVIDYDNKISRRKYIQPERANGHNLDEIYDSYSDFTDEGEELVLCDVYTAKLRSKRTGKKIGMPILYYKANLSGVKHDPNDFTGGSGGPDENIYDYKDNDELVTELGIPWDNSGAAHSMASTGMTLHRKGGSPIPADAKVFYEKTLDTTVRMTSKGTFRGVPFRPDSYILISAGYDGEYGTSDDMFNF